MKRFVPMMILIAVAAAMGCAARSFENSLTTEAQIASGVDFGSYHTWKYARADEYPMTGSAILDDPGYRKEVGREVVAKMQGKGYTKVDADPDFVLMIHLLSENKFDEQKMNDIYQGYDMAWAQMSDKDYWKEGTMMIFAMDAKTGKQIWNGVAKARLDQNTSDKTKKERFKKVVGMILDDLPPSGR